MFVVVFRTAALDFACDEVWSLDQGQKLRFPYDCSFIHLRSTQPQAAISATSMLTYYRAPAMTQQCAEPRRDLKPNDASPSPMSLSE
jgi:hypothetical protein